MAWYNFSARLDRAERQIAALIDEQEGIMTTIAELAAQVADAKAKTDQFPAAVDALEARITEALKNTRLSPEDQAAIEAAFADAKAIASTGSDAVADAADGVDEAGKA